MTGNMDVGRPKLVNLALQGGGSHGAFTWGVIDRLLDDPRLRLDGVSGTSAGAMNAVAMANGFMKDGRRGASAALREFWGRIGLLGGMAWLQKAMTGSWNLDDTPLYAMFDIFTRLFSPYELNPFDINPLKDIVDALIDFETLRHFEEIKLFVTATNVKTCKPRVFHTSELTTQVLMASACVPLLFKSVEIDGEFYWDGGYMGNPSIYPLIHECHSPDVIIVQINPLQRNEVPTTARDILNRITELSFNSSLVREMRGFATITSLIDSGRLADDVYSRVHFHMIEAGPELPALGVSSKFNTDQAFLDHLHDLGWQAAEAWLQAHFDEIGRCSSVDVFKTFV